jgi:protein-disulfide isomerase
MISSFDSKFLLTHPTHTHARIARKVEEQKNRKKYLNFVVLLWGRVADADAYAVVFIGGGEGRRERRGRDMRCR